MGLGRTAFDRIELLLAGSEVESLYNELAGLLKPTLETLA